MRQMDFKNHFFLTFVALLSLGVMAIKPGNTFRQGGDQRECKHLKGKVECSRQVEEYKINHSSEAISLKTVND